jgi:hypothetical protein
MRLGPKYLLFNDLIHKRSAGYLMRDAENGKAVSWLTTAGD